MTPNPFLDQLSFRSTNVIFFYKCPVTKQLITVLSYSMRLRSVTNSVSQMCQPCYSVWQYLEYILDLPVFLAIVKCRSDSIRRMPIYWLLKYLPLFWIDFISKHKRNLKRKCIFEFSYLQNWFNHIWFIKLFKINIHVAS